MDIDRSTKCRLSSPSKKKGFNSLHRPISLNFSLCFNFLSMYPRQRLEVASYTDLYFRFALACIYSIRERKTSEPPTCSNSRSRPNIFLA